MTQIKHITNQPNPVVLEYLKSLRKGRSKYGAKKTIVDGITFHSKRESERYSELKLLEKAGEISGLILQPHFELQERFSYGPEKIRKIEYVADFMYYGEDHDIAIIEDVKGAKTKEYNLKKKLFLYKYGAEYDFREVI